jgi:hypothetical protein
MDVIEVGRGEFTFGGDPRPTAVAAVRINGVDLRELVGEAAFMFLDDVAPPSRHWRGEPIYRLSEDGKAAVLTCSCGDFGCGGVSARITIDAETVTWSDFQEANSPKVIPLLAFRFSRSAYEAALSDLR